MKRNLLIFIKKSVLLALILIFCSQSGVLAQNQIKGIVRDSNKQSLPGVSVKIKGTTTGVVTDADGAFSLRAEQNQGTLVFSYIGFVTQEIAINGRAIYEISLIEDATALGEVVVTALGIKKDIRRLGVAIQTVDGASLVKAREPNAINALVGKVAGLTIGNQPELLRRPNISLRGNRDVLFVVDGVPINSDTWNVSADDIESYSVLKGASASALYGSRGKNGAILISTKRGSKDKRGFQIDFNTSNMVDNGFYAIPVVQDEYGPVIMENMPLVMAVVEG